MDQENVKPETAVNSHYFSPNPEGELVPREIQVTLAGEDYTVTTAGGIFSPEHIDTGTKILLASTPTAPATGNLLDLGCGWGPIALNLALESPDATVWAVDVNERALELVRINAQRLGLTNINAVLVDDVPADIVFETIWSNPPIRVGKVELHAILEAWIPRLAPDAEAWLVVQRNLGSESLQKWLETGFSIPLEVIRENISKGFRVTRVRRALA